MNNRTFHLAIGLLALGTALAAGELRLPKDRAYTGAPDSPGTVTFSHEAHVNPAAPSCTLCHPALFKMLQTSARKPVRHKDMEARRQCGACHDGQAAFALDSCERCHK